jgi:hypothetical protein
VEQPIEAPGVHVWRIKKILAGASGTRGRVGVLVRDCELDMDYKGPHFSNRAFFLDEDGNVWNGNSFVGFGAPWTERNSVVTLRYANVIGLFGSLIGLFLGLFLTLMHTSASIP